MNLTALPAQISYLFARILKWRTWIILPGLVLLISATVLADYLYAAFQQTGFYISESLLFSSYWTLFLLLIPLQLRLAKNARKLAHYLIPALLLPLLHLLLYPALIWLLSTLFYSYAFAYPQSLRYGLTAYLSVTLLLYGVVAVLLLLRRKQPLSQSVPSTSPTYVHSLIITDLHNTSIPIAVNEIACITAASPYSLIIHQSKKYLYSATLRALEDQLDPRQFIRVHKSHLVNIRHVRSYQSRRNGDYDLTLTDGIVLRVSRNYAKVFRGAFDEWHRLTLK